MKVAVSARTWVRAIVIFVARVVVILNIIVKGTKIVFVYTFI